MSIAKSMLRFVVAAIAEIGGAWLIWQGVREHRGWVWIGAGAMALGLYGFVATLRSPTLTSGGFSPPTAASSWPVLWHGEW